jgi:hypothetical protein
VLIEPGVIKTNVASSFKTGKNVDIGARAGAATNNDHNSPYAELTQNRIAALRPRFEAGLDPIEVAKVILKAAISENPDSRYLVGDDAFKLMNIRKNASDENFRKLIMQNILLK